MIFTSWSRESGKFIVGIYFPLTIFTTRFIVDIWISLGFWICQSSEYNRVLNIPGFWIGIIQTLHNAWGGTESRKLCYEPLRKSGGGEEVSIMLLRTTDKNFYMTNFMRNLPIGKYSLYYLASKALVFRWKLF